MQEIWAKISELSSDPVTTLLGLILGLSGITLAIIFYLKSRRYKELKFFVTSRTLFDEPEKRLEGLQITYNSIPQKRITVASIAIWNSGTETIVSDDIPTKYPLFIQLDEECEVLGCAVTRITEDATLFQISIPGNHRAWTKIPLSFEYLDKGHGATIQILHNGLETIPIKVKGKIKGGHGPNEINTRFIERDISWSRLKNDWQGALAYLSIGILAIIFGFILGLAWPLLAIGFVSLSAALVMYISYTKQRILMKYLRDL